MGNRKGAGGSLRAGDGHGRRVRPGRLCAIYQRQRRALGHSQGALPGGGAVRTTGTTVIIEDVAFPIERLAEGVAGLQQLFDRV